VVIFAAARDAVRPKAVAELTRPNEDEVRAKAEDEGVRPNAEVVRPNAEDVRPKDRPPSMHDAVDEVRPKLRMKGLALRRRSLVLAPALEDVRRKDEAVLANSVPNQLSSAWSEKMGSSSISSIFSCFLFSSSSFACSVFRACSMAHATIAGSSFCTLHADGLAGAWSAARFLLGATDVGSDCVTADEERSRLVATEGHRVDTDGHRDATEGRRLATEGQRVARDGARPAQPASDAMRCNSVAEA